MRITATIMAHPKRKDEANALYRQLKKMPFAACSITWDEINDEWHTGSRSLAAGLAVDADWHVVIQDDAILCPNFFENLEGALHCMGRMRWNTLVSLYTGTARPLGKRVTAAVNKAYHATWLRSGTLMWGVGIVMPTSHINPVLEFCEGRDEPYDTRIGCFYVDHGAPVFYTMPSLVDHDDDRGSLLGHGIGPDARVAHRLADGLVQWNTEQIQI